MADAHIMQELSDIFRELFDDDSIVLTPETTAEDIPDWDSFNHVNLIVAAEQKFGVRFQTAEIEGLKNVGQLASVIQAKLK